jgi:zinc transport system substrate-binding protein
MIGKGFPMRYIISLVLASLALPAWAEVPKVVTDIPPVHALVAQVMGDLGTPDLLLERGASEHDFQLRPSQAAGLADAGLVVWIGPELTPWLDRALEGLGEGAKQLPLLAVPGTVTHAYAEGGAHMEAGHDDHGHDDHAEEEAGHDDHDHSGTDPHAWLDPANAKLWLGAIAQDLSDLDPDNAATYAANAAAAAAGIDRLDADLNARFAPLKDRPIVVFHDAYGYLADRYGLQIFGSIALGDATAPGAARLAALRDATAQGTVLCVFPEAQHDAALAEQLAEGSGAKLGPALDPNGSTLDPGPDLYAQLLTGLADAMLGCSNP